MKEENQKRELTLKNDIVFKAFFGRKGNEKYLKSFLEALLNISIISIEIKQEATLDQLLIKQKMGRLDIKATVEVEKETKIVNIEMQLKNNKDIKQRTTYYGSRLMAEQLDKKEKYLTIKPVILVNILNYNFLEVPEYCTETITVSKEHRGYEVIDEIKYYFIELPKFRKKRPDLNNVLESWLALIDSEERGTIEMAKEKHKIIKEAKEDLDKILSEGVLKEIAEFEETAIYEENARIHCAKLEGKESEQIRIAKELIKLQIDIEKIMTATGLPKSKIEELKQELE